MQKLGGFLFFCLCCLMKKFGEILVTLEEAWQELQYSRMQECWKTVNPFITRKGQKWSEWYKVFLLQFYLMSAEAMKLLPVFLYFAGQNILFFWDMMRQKAVAFFEAIQGISLYCVRVLEALYNHSKFSLEFGFFHVLYSSLLHLPPLRFHCVRMLGSNPGLMRL